MRDGLKENLDGAKEAIAQYRMESEMQKAERIQRRQERRQELEQLFENLKSEMDGRVFGQGRLMKAFPQMRSLNHKQALERLRRHISRR